jgi:hypothetical protein
MARKTTLHTLLIHPPDMVKEALKPLQFVACTLREPAINWRILSRFQRQQALWVPLEHVAQKWAPVL